MLTLLTLTQKSLFTTATLTPKIYDLITIGPHANNIAKLLAKQSQSHIKPSIVTIQQQPTLMQASLVPLSLAMEGKVAADVRLQQGNGEFSDFQCGVAVDQIDAGNSRILLKNGHRYHYRNLVYSTHPQTSTNTLNETISQIPTELLHQRSGRLIFTIPKQPHSAYENMFIFLLKEKLEKNRGKDIYGLEPLDIVVVCQGQLCGYNQEFSGLVERYMRDSGIKVIKNSSYNIDAQKKHLILNTPTPQTLPYTFLYQYAQTPPPHVLTTSNIDPTNINSSTLQHKHHPNLYLLANSLPHVPSISAYHSMSRIVARNLYYSLCGIRKYVGYDGFTGVNLWVGENQCHYVELDYGSQKIRKDYGKSRYARYAMAVERKLLWRKHVQLMVNYPEYNIFGGGSGDMKENSLEKERFESSGGQNK